MNEQHELQASDLSFYPPLRHKTKESRDVYLSTPSGKIYRGIRMWRRRIRMPDFVVLNNRPEIGEREVFLSAMTRDLLMVKIRDRLFNFAAGLVQ